MSFFSKTSAMWLAAVAGLVAAPAVAATVQTTPQAVLAQAAPPTDEQLEAFAAAAVHVEQIRRAAVQQAQAIEGEDEIQQFVEETQAQMEDAVRQEGLTVEQYNVLAQLVSQDPDLNQRIEQMVAEELGG